MEKIPDAFFHIATWGFILAVLAGCNKRIPEGPAGQINLRYTGHSQSTIRFVLENRTDQTIYVHGSQRFGEDPSPWNTDFVCEYNNGSLYGSSFLGNEHLAWQEILIARERQLPIEFDKSFISVKGDSCHAELHLPSGVLVLSNDFQL